MDDAVVLELMRHAKTKGNVERRYVGWTDDPIVEAALPVVDDSAQLVICSDLIRTEQTARAYFPNASLHPIKHFRESHFGDFDMKTYDELKTNAHYRAWIEHPETVAPPNGETLTAFSARVLEGLKQLPTARHYYAVLHGGTIRALLVALAPEPSQFWDWQVGHDTRFVLSWHSRRAFEEGKRCTSLSVVPLTANAPM